MVSIRVAGTNNQNIIAITKDLRNIVKKCCISTLYEEGYKGNYEVSITFTDNEQIKELNAQYRNKDYKFNMKSSLYIKLSLICIVLLIVLAYNIMIKNNSFEKILSIYNFTNFYVPILIASSLILDSLLAYILINKLKN